MAAGQPRDLSTDTPPSQASQLPQGECSFALWPCCCSAFDLAFDLRRPVKPRWPQAGIAQWAPRQDAGVAATRPWMADRGGPTEQCLTAGMPSQSEAPSGGARALWLLSRSSKVTRRKGGTLSRRDRYNGYVHIPKSESYRYSRSDPTSQLKVFSKAYSPDEVRIACNSTSAPAVDQCGWISSASLWLKPSTHGTKIIAVGATLFR